MATELSVAELDDLYTAGRAVRRRFEPDAYLNIAFYLGQQWTHWDGNQVFDLVLDQAAMEVDNRIEPTVRNEIAKMTKTQPQWVAVPKTQSDDDIAATRFTEAALDDAWKRKDMSQLLRAALLWSRLTPCGYWKVWWDSALGPKRDVLVYGDGHPQAGKVIRAQDQSPMSPDLAHALPPEAAAKQTSVARGDMCLELRTFFHLVVDPLADETGLESAGWVIDEGVYSRKHMRRHFPEMADSLSYDADPSAGNLEGRMPYGGIYDTSTTQAGKGTRVREYWDEDQHVIWVPGGQELHREANPYPFIPYVMFGGLPVPGRFYPDSIVTQLRPRQVALNKRISQIADNAERIGNSPLMVPSSMDPDFQWEGLPGEKVVYQDTGSPNAMPSFMQVPEMPGYVQADVERIERSIQEGSGQHEVSGAQVPTGVTAASAISLLQEQDDTRLGPDIAAMERAIARAGQRMLHIIRHYYSDERSISIVGEAGRWDMVAFKGDQLDGVEHIDVQAGSGMPASKAAKQSAIQQMMGLILQNPEMAQGMTGRDFRKIFSEFDVGGLDQFFASIGRDEQQVEDENRRLSMGEQFDINSYDTDPAHVEFHTDFQKTAAYQRLDEGRKAFFEAHVQAHRQRMAVAQMGPPPTPPPFPGAPPGVNMPAPDLAASGNGGPPPVPSSPPTP